MATGGAAAPKGAGSQAPAGADSSAARRETRREGYDTSGPPDALRVAARSGDLAAIQAAADWYRDRGQPADPNDPEGSPGDERTAYYVEVYRREM